MNYTKLMAVSNEITEKKRAEKVEAKKVRKQKRKSQLPKVQIVKVQKSALSVSKELLAEVRKFSNATGLKIYKITEAALVEYLERQGVNMEPCKVLLNGGLTFKEAE